MPINIIPMLMGKYTENEVIDGNYKLTSINHWVIGNIAKEINIFF